MNFFNGNIKLIVYIMVIIGTTMVSPMFYKKKENDIYEPGEWIEIIIICIIEQN